MSKTAKSRSPPVPLLQHGPYWLLLGTYSLITLLSLKENEMRTTSTVIEHQMRTDNDDTRNNHNKILIDTVEVKSGVGQDFVKLESHN